jgi:hypothetical protein
MGFIPRPLWAAVMMLAIFAVCVTAQRVDLGDWSLADAQNLAIVSRSIRTHVVLEVDSSLTAPVVTVSAFGPFPVDQVTRGLVRVSGNSVEIKNWDAQNEDDMGAAPSSSPSALQWTLPVLIALAVAFAPSSFKIVGSRTSNASSWTSVALALVFGVAILSLAQAITDHRDSARFTRATGPYVEVRLRVPSSVTVVGGILLDLVEGEVTSAEGSTLSVADFAVQMCSDSADSSSTVTLDALVVTSSVSICAPGAVSVTNLLQAGPAIAVNLKSENSSVALSSPYFTGTFELSGTTTSHTGAACTLDSGATAAHRTGVCGSSESANTLTVEAATSASLAAIAGCPTGFTGDGPMAANVPSSPAVVPATSRLLQLDNAALWRPWIEWGGVPFANVTNNSTAGGIDVSIAKWVPGYFWLSTINPLPFRAGSPTTFKLSITGADGPPPSMKNASVILIEGAASNTYNILGNAFNDSHPQVLDSYHWDAPFNGQEQTITLTAPNDTASARLLIRVRWNSPVGRIWSLNLRTLSLNQPVIAPTEFQHGTSEVVQQEKMPSSLDSNPRTSCPHIPTTGLSHWHNASIWPGGIMPNPAGNIRIPDGLSVLISSCSLLPTSFVYNRIHVPATSKLIFADANINMRVRNIFVEGELHMGGPACRLNAKINIEFVGSKTEADNIAPGLGSKGIGVGMTGSIDIHGRQFHPTWTRLSATIWPGANTIYVQDTNNWEVGQTIVIATSAYKDIDVDQNEVRTIVAIDQSGKRIQLDSALLNYHYAGEEHQAEVGLLSRRIVLSGDLESEREQFGGHTRVTGEGRFSGVQTRRMGQLNMLGKYPFHFHAMGESPTSFVKDCSIWESYFRCIAIHATNSSQALRNVVFNATAHCYYLEDGIEEHNVINYNLAVKINTIGAPMEGESQTGDKRWSSPELILPADGAAAGFYITNAYNTFIGNAASGGWAGFSFPNLPSPIGLSRHYGISPQKRPTKIFRSNTAHSSGYHFPGGGCIYVGGMLKYDPPDSDTLFYDNGRFSRPTVDSSNKEAWMQFNDTKVWMCRMGVSHWGDRIEIVGFESHDTGRSVQVFGEAWFSQALVNAESGSLIKYPGKPTGFQFYDTYVKSIVTQVTFRGFTANDPPYDMETTDYPFAHEDRRVFSALIHSDYFKPQGISAVANIQFDNCDESQIVEHKRITTGASRYFNFVDWSGSIGNAGIPQIIGSGIGWWHYDEACTYVDAWKSWRCPQGDRTVVNLRYMVPGSIESNTGDLPPVPGNYLGNTYLFGPGIPEGRNATLTKNPGVTGVSKIGWYFHMTAGTPATFSIFQALNPINHWVVGAWKYPASTTFEIVLKMDWGGGPFTVTSTNSMANLLAGNGRLYYFDDSHLYIKMVNPNDNIARGFNYTRDGVTLWDVVSPIHYDVVANCPGKNGNWCPSTYVAPTRWT